MPRLRERERIPTSGARAIEHFRLDDYTYLAIPQLAYDAPESPPGMNGGDSNTDLLLLRLESGEWETHQRIPVPGGEDAEFFVIGERAFLAVASVRSGAGPYSYTSDSVVYEWDGDNFREFQRFPCFAAKQWRHFSFPGRHFLGLAQGVWLPGGEADDLPSVLFEWDRDRFVEFQEIPSKWAYNWCHLHLDGVEYLAHADHVEPSRLYRFDGERFVEHQELVPRAGRAFAHFTSAGVTYLACAVIEGDSRAVSLGWRTIRQSSDARRRRRTRIPGDRDGRGHLCDSCQLHHRRTGETPRRTCGRRCTASMATSWWSLRNFRRQVGLTRPSSSKEATG